MQHKVLKRFYDPFLKRHTVPGETIEVPEELYESYKAYITEKPKPEVKATPELSPIFKYEERPKKNHPKKVK